MVRHLQRLEHFEVFLTVYHCYDARVAVEVFVVAGGVVREFVAWAGERGKGHR
jgi:hypothetical protein